MTQKHMFRHVFHSCLRVHLRSGLYSLGTQVSVRSQEPDDPEVCVSAHTSLFHRARPRSGLCSLGVRVSARSQKTGAPGGMADAYGCMLTPMQSCLAPGVWWVCGARGSCLQGSGTACLHISVAQPVRCGVHSTKLPCPWCVAGLWSTWKPMHSWAALPFLHLFLFTSSISR